MWIVASNDYEDNPWLDSLTYRLLTNESNVVNLLDSVGIQKRFQRTSWPPKYIRGSVYLHQFTTMNTESSQDTKYGCLLRSLFFVVCELMTFELATLGTNETFGDLKELRIIYLPVRSVTST